MSQGATIDYDALAQQHGGQVAAPAVDYDALAAQHGGQAVEQKGFFSRMLDKGDQFYNSMLDKTESGVRNIGAGNYFKGAHEIVQGAAPLAAPFLPEALVAAPAATLLGGAGALVAGKVSRPVSGALGATPDQQDFIEDLANFAGGYAGAKAGGAVTSGAKALVNAIKPNNPGELAEVATRGLTGMVPGLNKFSKFRSPTVDEVLGALKKAYATGDAPIPKELEPYVSAPYGKSGDQLTDATTVMPRKVLGPDRQLNAAPEPTAATPAPANPPATSKVLKDAGVTQAMKDAGVAAPSASIRPVRPGVTGDIAPRSDISFPPGLSGEDAANMQLTRYNINELRFMAQRRGLPVSPKDTHIQLIDKLSGSLTPDEVQGFATAAAQSKPVVSKFPENNDMAANLNQAAAALQEAKGNPYEVASLRSAASTIANHPANIAEVDLTANKIKGVDKRIGKRINDFFANQKENDSTPIPLPETSAQTPQVPTSMEHAMELMRQTLAARAGK